MDDGWLNDFERRPPSDEPAYVRIADAIADAVVDGQLAVGQRLPTHRALAQRLGLAVPTITRAYQAATERGLIVSTVGRGTFVAGIPNLRDTEDHAQRGLDMAVNAPIRGPQEAAMRAALARMSKQADLQSVLEYAADIGSARHRELARTWLGRRGLDAPLDNVALTHGGQHALLLALAATAQSGGTIATEALTYPGVRSAAHILGLDLAPLALDEFGLVPEAFRAWCASTAPPRVLYTMPVAHNPTARTQPASRRRELVKIAQRYDATIIEDDVFGVFDDGDAPPLAALAPERTLHLTSFSKALSPGLRCGILAGPSSVMPRVGPLIRATVFNAAPLQTALTMAWVEDGTADRLVDWQRDEAKHRRDRALKRLDGCPAVSALTAAALHVWVELAAPWTAAEAIEAAAAAGVLIGPTSHFVINAPDAPPGVRLCLGNAPTIEALDTALERLSDSWRRPLWASGTRV
jgi:DNA-binding transcriptional MocR family regulator